MRREDSTGSIVMNAMTIFGVPVTHEFAMSPLCRNWDRVKDIKK